MALGPLLGKELRGNRKSPPAAALTADLDLDSTMRSTWFGTKVRIEATIEAELYREIQKIIEREQKQARERDWPEVPISHVVEMILRKGVRAYREEKEPRTQSTL